MANNMLNDMEFENQLVGMGDDQLELIKFVARQQFTVSKIVAIHEEKIVTQDKAIDDIKNGDKRVAGITGGLTGLATGVLTGIINYLMNRG